MRRPFSYVENKVLEAEFFLDQIINASYNIFSVQCNFSAFVSATRSITFAMQSVMKDAPNFNEWYQEKQEEIKANELALFFQNARKISIHIGINPINRGTMIDGEFKHYFTRLDEYDGFVPGEDIVTCCLEYFKLLLKLVKECLEKFESVIDPIAYSYNSLQTMRRDGLTTEDLEQSLGYPKGWTHGLPTEERLRILKPLDDYSDFFRIYQRFVKLKS